MHLNIEVGYRIDEKPTKIQDPGKRMSNSKLLGHILSVSIFHSFPHCFSLYLCILQLKQVSQNGRNPGNSSQTSTLIGKREPPSPRVYIPISCKDSRGHGFMSPCLRSISAAREMDNRTKPDHGSSHSRVQEPRCITQKKRRQKALMSRPAKSYYHSLSLIKHGLTKRLSGHSTLGDTGR